MELLLEQGQAGPLQRGGGVPGHQPQLARGHQHQRQAENSRQSVFCYSYTVVWDIPGDEREQAEGEADDPVARLEAVEADCPEHEVSEAGQDALADADHAELRAQRVLRRPIREDQRSANHSSPGTGTSR